MKLLEAYNPAEVRACGRMVKAIQAAGGTAEDILGYAAYAEANATDSKLVHLRLVLKRPQHESVSKEELLGAFGPGLLREWMRITKDLLKFEFALDEIRTFVSQERKKELNSTKFGPLRP
jgi:hypothetical protein